MSGKRFNPLEDPPNASSSDEDNEVETTSLGGNSSSEEEETDDESPPLKKKPETAPEKHHHSPDSESGSDEEETDSETEKKHPIKKNPGSSVVKKTPVVVKKPSSTKKRSLSETDGASTEAKKKVKSDSGDETKKIYFQRVWTEEDEIAALQGLVDYKKDTGVSPYDDTNAFYRSVKKSISFDVSKIQVMKKLNGLKKKYENNLGKEKKGEELTFSKPHDRKAYDLSKFVWGAEGVAALESAVKSSGKSKKRKKVESLKQELASSTPNGKGCEEEEEEGMTNKGEAASSVAELDAFVNSGVVKSIARFGMDDLSAQEGWRRLSSEDKKRFEDEWKVLQLRELEFCSQKSGFIHEVVTKMAESFRSNP